MSFTFNCQIWYGRFTKYLFKGINMNVSNCVIKLIHTYKLKAFCIHIANIHSYCLTEIVIFYIVNDECWWKKYTPIQKNGMPYIFL